METILEELLEKSKTDLHVLQGLKNVAVNNGMYVLSRELLNFEKEHFPERENLVVEQEKAHKLKTAFEMVGIGIENDKTTWIIHTTTEMLIQKGGDFDIADSTSIKAKANEIFGK